MPDIQHTIRYYLSNNDLKIELVNEFIYDYLEKAIFSR